LPVSGSIVVLLAEPSASRPVHEPVFVTAALAAGAANAIMLPAMASALAPLMSFVLMLNVFLLGRLHCRP
jgi:hypothetical protein